MLRGRMVATVRNPSCLIHGGAITAGVAAIVSGEKTGMGPGIIPKNVVIDGPVVTKAQRAWPGMDGRTLPDLTMPFTMWREAAGQSALYMLAGRRPNVRFGSLADITARSRHVRFTFDSGHSSVQVGCPLCAISGHKCTASYFL